MLRCCTFHYMSLDVVRVDLERVVLAELRERRQKLAMGYWFLVLSALLDLLGDWLALRNPRIPGGIAWRIPVAQLVVISLTFVAYTASLDLFRRGPMTAWRVINSVLMFCGAMASCWWGYWWFVHTGELDATAAKGIAYSTAPIVQGPLVGYFFWPTVREVLSRRRRGALFRLAPPDQRS